MKLEVELTGIFADEEGNEVNDSVRETIISEVTERIFSAIQKKMEGQISAILTKGIDDKVRSHMDTILPELMDYEFVEVTSWGEKKEKYTVRNRILKSIESQAVFKDSSYRSDQNSFTQLVNKLFDIKFEDLKKNINKEVDAKFTREAMAYAEKKLSERLGVK